ncbi:CPBP family intramembrane glutamic endopeptidase [Planctomicrobium sp. SH664]|uniref:CPBP family intramembrane glutamic endopeptidase n=1 Tax=Planctomicrobium sp. SH664 TaxID=3448125 RepID=UPI003F5C59FA
MRFRPKVGAITNFAWVDVVANESELITQLLSLTVTLPLVASLIFWVWGMRQLVQGRPLLPARFRSPDRTVPPAIIVFTGLWIVMNLVQSAPPPGDFDSGQILANARVQFYLMCGLAGTLLLLFTLLCRRPLQLVKLGFRVDHLTEQVSIGVIGAIASLVPVLLTLLLTYPLRSEETVHALLRLLAERGFTSEMIPIVVLAVVLAPLLEELMYRVTLQNWLVDHLNPVGGIVLTSLIFACAHGFPDSIGIFVLALGLGYVYHRSRSVLAVMLMHSLFNAYNVWSVLVSQLQESGA